MAGCDVRDFVGHNTGQLGFVVSGENESFIYVKETARQCERVYFVRINDLDRERHLCIGVQHDVLPNAVHVFGDNRIVDKLGLAIDLRSRLASHPHFLFSGAAHLGDDSGIDVPLADHGRVFVSRERFVRLSNRGGRLSRGRFGFLLLLRIRLTLGSFRRWVGLFCLWCLGEHRHRAHQK